MLSAGNSILTNQPKLNLMYIKGTTHINKTIQQMLVLEFQEYQSIINHLTHNVRAISV